MGRIPRTAARPKPASLGSGPRVTEEAPRQRSIGASADGELIRRIGEDDREAFEAQYRRFARPVLGMALRRLGRPPNRREHLSAPTAPTSSHRYWVNPESGWMITGRRPFGKSRSASDGTQTSEQKDRGVATVRTAVRRPDYRQDTNSPAARSGPPERRQT